VTILAALALALPLAGPAAAAKPTLPPTPPDVAARMNALFARATPAVRSWVDAEARRLRGSPPPDASALAADARLAFPGTRPPLTPGQADALAAMALYQVVNDLESETRLAAADALARLVERKNTFLRALSILLRRFSDADAAVVTNLK
jgi:hypothetical protein